MCLQLSEIAYEVPRVVQRAADRVSACERWLMLTPDNSRIVFPPGRDAAPFIEQRLGTRRLSCGPVSDQELRDALAAGMPCVGSQTVASRYASRLAIEIVTGSRFERERPLAPTPAPTHTAIRSDAR